MPTWFLSCPPEVLTHIAHHLIDFTTQFPFKNLVNFARVCKRTNEVAYYLLSEHRRGLLYINRISAIKAESDRLRLQRNALINQLNALEHASTRLTEESIRIGRIQYVHPIPILLLDAFLLQRSAPQLTTSYEIATLGPIGIPVNHGQFWKPSDRQYNDFYEYISSQGFERYHVPSKFQKITSRIYSRVSPMGLHKYKASDDYCCYCNKVGHRPGSAKCNKKYCPLCYGLGRHKFTTIGTGRAMCPLSSTKMTGSKINKLTRDEKAVAASMTASKNVRGARSARHIPHYYDISSDDDWWLWFFSFRVFLFLICIFLIFIFLLFLFLFFLFLFYITIFLLFTFLFYITIFLIFCFYLEWCLLPSTKANWSIFLHI